MKASIKQIYITDVDNKCVICKDNMYPYVNIVPINDTYVVKIPGHYCRNCKKFFYKDLKYIDDLLNKNDFAADYDIITDYYIKPAIRRKYSEFKSTFYTIYLKDDKTNVIEKVIVVSDKKEVVGGINVYHYTDIVARTLLADILHFHQKQIVLNNKNYCVISAENSKCISENSYIIDKLYIRENGGFYSYSGNNNIVDLLLYSPFTKRFEIINATYDKILKYYYVDMSKYKMFIDQYGNPGVLVEFFSDIRTDVPYNRKKESILHALGYNVSKTDDLSDNQRQSIISFTLDVGLMTTKEIEDLLKDLIKQNKGKNMAIMKWEKDIEFTKNYNINPDRFIIAKNN